MAKITDVKPELRRHALGVPAAILARLSAAELEARCAEAARLHDAASHAQADHARWLTRNARKVLRSKPIAEYAERDRELSALAGQSSRQVHHSPDGKLWSLAGSYEAARRAHRDEHAYPDGLPEAVDRHMLGQRHPHPELASLADAILSSKERAA